MQKFTEVRALSIYKAVFAMSTSPLPKTSKYFSFYSELYNKLDVSSPP